MSSSLPKPMKQQGNDHAANIIRSYYTGDYGEQGKVVLDEATEQTTYYETGWYEPDVLGSGGSYYGVTKATSEEEALQTAAEALCRLCTSYHSI